MDWITISLICVGGVMVFLSHLTFKKFNIELKKIEIKVESFKRKQLLDFLYWRENEIHPDDANKLVDKYLNGNNDDE